MTKPPVRVLTCMENQPTIRTGKMRVGCACCTAYPHGLSLRCGFGFLDGSRGAAAAVQAQELQGILVEILVAGVKYGDFIFLLPVGQVKRPQLLLDGGVLVQD